MSDRVSVIIPNFNRGAMLLEAVESCLAQTGVDAEIIVVDDGSTDGSAEAVKHRYPNILLIQQQNAGACAARNRGLAAASGQYIKFIDSDDTLATNVLAGQIECLQRTQADVVYGDFQFSGNVRDARVGGKPLRVVGTVVDPLDALLGDWWCAPFCYLYRAEVIGTTRWNATLNCLQDFDFVLRIALSGARFAYAPGVVGYYRMHHGQITESSAESYARNRCAILDSISETLAQSARLTASRRQLLANGYWSAARAFYRTDRVRFEAAVQKISTLTPRFAPTLWEPWPVRALTGAVGIRRAERILDLRRTVAQQLRRGLR
jgi:glycosyltransferase involved in cell wall biosynthesis